MRIIANYPIVFAFFLAHQAERICHVGQYFLTNVWEKVRWDFHARAAPVVSLPGVAAVLVLALLTASCTRTVNPNLQSPPMLVEPLPLTVGVYYDDKLRNYLFEADLCKGCGFLMGSANVSFFDRLFSEIFASTVPVKSKFQMPDDAQELDAIIEPKIVSSDRHLVDDGHFIVMTTMAIKYKVVLYSSGGEQLSAWTASGEVRHRALLPETIIELAIRDAGSKLAVAIYNDPAIQKCVETPSTESRSPGWFKKCLTEH